MRIYILPVDRCEKHDAQHFSTYIFKQMDGKTDHVNAGVTEKFEALLLDYFRSEKPQETGIPMVGYFANTAIDHYTSI